MTNEELIKYNSFLFKEIELIAKRLIKPIYRGDSLKNLCDKLNVLYDYENTDFLSICDRLFMVGEKAKRYYINDDGFEIDNVDNYVFNKIMKYFKTSLKNRNPNIISFFDRNIDLKNFFSESKNKGVFLKIIDRLNESEKNIIRNYYLILLHQMAAINYKNKSHFVSTSEDYSIALEFSESSKDQNRVVLHCWQPIKIERNVVKKYNLPIYTLGPYHYQREFSILGGILPHFILGIENARTKEFYPNPNIFRSEITNKTFLYGLNIDQTDFEDILELTNYKKSIVTNGIHMWENSTSSTKSSQ